MIWVSWRQQRTETIIGAAILVALAALLIPSGINMASAYHDAHLGSCLGAHASRACDFQVGSFVQRFEGIANLIAWFTLVPGLIGVLLAAPFVNPFEQGTYRLDWTQSISRGNWISRKLGMAVAAALVASLVLTVLIAWWRAPLVRLQGRMDNSAYDSQGIVIFGYTLFALGLALAIGVLWRRAVPGVLVGFAGYFVGRIFVDTWLRQRLVPTHSVTWGGRNDPAVLQHAWRISEYPSDAHGNPVDLACLKVGANPLPGCLRHPPKYMHAIFHPASQFWQLQIMETALFGGLAVLLIAFSAWWTLRRAA
ncbi:MAG TPA: hypothetical protein VGQ38_14875 [Gaiellaceae bacterium]|jgi:hypothetical protein|nr:hypothetical protein [Gaiellaceae bacterium]